jgi:chaperonin cofactor prefoldin
MYAGDARFEDILPDKRRLISYAEDLSVQVVREADALPEQVVKLSIKNGVFSYVTKQRRATEYRLIQHGTETSKILVQHPKRTGWDLVQPVEAEEETASYYRFIRELKEDEESQLLKVVEEYPQDRTVQIRNLDSGQISFYLKNVSMSAELRRALSRTQTLQQRINQLQRQKAEVQSKIDSIYRTQERIRSNMEQLDRDSDLYRQYAARLGRQEAELDELEERLDTHSEQVISTEDELNRFLSGLNVES